MADEPQDSVAGIAEDYLATLLDETEFAVGQVVAHQTAATHTERMETVALLHGTDGKRESHIGSIERGTMRVATDGNGVGNTNAKLPIVMITVGAGLGNAEHGQGTATLVDN